MAFKELREHKDFFFFTFYYNYSLLIPVFKKWLEKNLKKQLL